MGQLLKERICYSRSKFLSLKSEPHLAELRLPEKLLGIHVILLCKIEIGNSTQYNIIFGKDTGGIY